MSKKYRDEIVVGALAVIGHLKWRVYDIDKKTRLRKLAP